MKLIAGISTARRVGLAACGLALLSLVGCVVSPYPRGPVVMESYPAPGPVIVAPMAPPPIYQETVVVAPAPGYLWINGFWSWSGSRHVWTGGHWAPPRPGYRWAPRQWERGPGGWYQRGGHWHR